MGGAWPGAEAASALGERLAMRAWGRSEMGWVRDEEAGGEERCARSCEVISCEARGWRFVPVCQRRARPYV